MKQPNRVKAAMRASRKAYGYSLSFPSPWVIDILGKLDFDYVFIDGEHEPFGLDQLEDLCRTAERYNLTPIARVPDIGSSTILRYLDRGIMGILGPHIATEADARQLVRACYFGRKRSVKDACRRSPVGAMMRHGGDSKGSVHYRVGGH